MTQRERDIFIALIDAGLDESAVLSFVEGETTEAAGVVEALAGDAHLAELVWQMRADRDAIGTDAAATPVPASTHAMVASVLDQEISSEIDANKLRTLVENDAAAATRVAPPKHKPVKVRKARSHSFKFPNRAQRIVGSLAAAAVLVLIVSIALPNMNFGATNNTNHQPLANNNTETPIMGTTDAQLADASNDVTLTGDDDLIEEPRRVYRPEERPIVVATADEALKLAREGRLIVRITSYRDSTTQTLATQLTSGSDLMRFAAVEGHASSTESQTFAGALPRFEEPIIASADEPRQNARPVTTRESEGAYMLRVEPTERAFTMLIAKLRNYDGATVELIGATDPVTTPGSAADLSGLSESPTTWKPRITVPVVIESIQ